MRIGLGVRIAIVVLFASFPAFAQVPAGGEFRVNAYTTNDQVRPSIGSLGDGWVLVWASVSQDGSGAGIFGRHLDTSGAFVGSEFQANSYTTGHQAAPVVDAGPDDSFVVAWMTDTDVAARRFDSILMPIWTSRSRGKPCGSTPICASSSATGRTVSSRCA